jgi:hypothetical protein
MTPNCLNNILFKEWLLEGQLHFLQLRILASKKLFKKCRKVLCKNSPDLSVKKLGSNEPRFTGVITGGYWYEKVLKGCASKQ